MHLEILVEDSSGCRLLEAIVPKIIGPHAEPHTWRLIPYKGLGRLPAGLTGSSDPHKRILLDQLPRILRGYGKTPGIDGVIVVVDADRRDSAAVLAELHDLLSQVDPAPPTMFRLAIEEIEAWYFGDREALLSAYPKARRDILDRYTQDAVCGTWELLADALNPGGAAAIKKVGFTHPGEVKHAWAAAIGPRMDPQRNRSPSFQTFVDALTRLTATSPETGDGPRATARPR